MKDRDKLFRTLSLFTSIVCLALFFWFVYYICKKYFDNATLVLSSTQEQLGELPLPALIACYRTPYKRFSNITIWNKEEYSSLTDDPQNMVRWVWIENCPFCKGFRPKFNLSELVTVYSGRCLKIEVDTKVHVTLK